jgi:sugar diacid utilization regulator
MVVGSPAGSQSSDGARRRGSARIDTPLPNLRPHPDLAELERLRTSLSVLQQENSNLRLLIAIHDRLGALVLQRAGVDSITVMLAEMVRRPVLLLDPQLQPVAVESHAPAPADGKAATVLWNPNEAYVSRVLQTLGAEPRPLRLPPLPAWGVGQGCVIAPIVVGDTTLGYLAVLEPVSYVEDAAAAEADLLAVQHAASVYALALMRERMAAEVTTQLRDELIEGLLLGNIADEQAVRERARRLGYDETLVYRTLVFVPDDTSRPGPRPGGAEAAWAPVWRRRLLENLATWVRDRAPRAIVTARHDELVALVGQSADPAPADLGRAATLHVASRDPERPLTVGIGGACRSPLEIAQSYSQARRAVEVARRFGRRGEVVTFEDLGLYRLLFQVADQTELRAFVEQVLGPLMEYDRKHKTDFIRTIATYLTNNNSLQATARDLMVHVNTATYRIHRIQAITGLDLTKAEDCLQARVALMILEGADQDRG